MKAFFSFAVIAMVSVALFFFAGMAFSTRDYREASVSALEARKVDARMQDAQQYLDAAFDDLLLDSTYKIFNCTAPAPNLTAGQLCAEITSAARKNYLVAVQNLSGDGVSVSNYTSINVFCTNQTLPAGPPYEYNVSFNVSLLTRLRVNSSHARAEALVRFYKQGNATIPNFTQPGWSDPVAQFRLFLNETSYKNATGGTKNFTWHVNCSA